MNSSTACSVPSSPSFWSASHGELEHTPDTQSGGSHWTCNKDQLVHCLNLILSIGAPPPLYLPVLTCNRLCQLLAYNYLHHSRVQEPGNEATGTYELVWYHAILYLCILLTGNSVINYHQLQTIPEDVENFCLDLILYSLPSCCCHNQQWIAG